MQSKHIMVYFLNVQYMYHGHALCIIDRRQPHLALKWVHDAINSFFNCLKAQFG